jgi:hypothetical protein
MAGGGVPPAHVDAARADLIGARTEIEAYLRVCAERHRPLRTHRWDEQVIERLIEGGARRTRRRRSS